ncbi:MAG: flagellar brake protein [Clostridium sp.]|nr:flagellar brake protein [Clostridium sp.]
MEMGREYINTKLELEVVDEKGERVGPLYTTKILETRGTKVNISAPIFGKHTVPLPVDTKFRILSKTRFKDRNFINGIVTSRFKSDNQTILQTKMELVSADKSAVSSAVRTDCDLVAEYKYIDADEGHEYTPVKVINISPEDVTVLVNSDVEIYKEVDMYIWVAKRKVINAECNIIGKRQIGNMEKYSYEFKGCFTKITQLDRDEIIKLIFKSQKEQAKRKRGRV